MQVLFIELKGIIGKGIAQEFFGLLVKFLNEIMTREIKFRAWDNEEKKFFEPTYEGYAGKVECLSISLTGR